VRAQVLFLGAQARQKTNVSGSKVKMLVRKFDWSSFKGPANVLVVGPWSVPEERIDALMLDGRAGELELDRARAAHKVTTDTARAILAKVGRGLETPSVNVVGFSDKGDASMLGPVEIRPLAQMPALEQVIFDKTRRTARANANHDYVVLTEERDGLRKHVTNPSRFRLVCRGRHVRTSTVALADHLMSPGLRANIDLVIVWVNGFWSLPARPLGGSDEATSFAKALWAAFVPTLSPGKAMTFGGFHKVWQHSRQSAEPVCLVIDNRVGCQRGTLAWCRVAEEAQEEEEEVEDDFQRVVLEGQDEVKSND
jgi:hypothetical protein